jgi:hypothetical protein
LVRYLEERGIAAIAYKQPRSSLDMAHHAGSRQREDGRDESGPTSIGALSTIPSQPGRRAPPKDRSIVPVGRSRSSQRRGLGRQVATAELAARSADVLDPIDEAHASAAARALERVDVEDSRWDQRRKARQELGRRHEAHLIAAR